MTDKTKKIIAREGLIALVVYIAAIYPILILGRIIFTNLSPFNLLKMNALRGGNIIAMLLGTIYLFSIYGIIRLIVHFIIWAIRTLKVK